MRYWHVDAFTDAPFHGNPAAVVLHDRVLSELQLAELALELNLPATVYVQPLGEDEFAIRWFTPQESGLCGHGTLAATHALWEAGLARGDRIALHSPAGALAAQREGALIALDFPALRLPACATSPQLSAALGSTMVSMAADSERTLAELPSVADLEALRPDPLQLAALGLRKLIVTARDQRGQYDFVSRYFKARQDGGYDEDPVTGSAHCVLAPYWAEKLAKSTFEAYQASRRGGVLQVTLDGARVVLRGRAVTLGEGVLRLPPT